MTQPQNPNGNAKAIESRDYQIDFERDGKTHRICVRHHEVKSGVIQPHAAWDATEQDLRQAGFVLVNGAEFAAVSAELEAVRLELKITFGDWQTERARAEETERRVQEEDARAVEWMNTADQRLRDLAAANARAGRLEEALRTIVQQRHDWAQGLGDGSALGDVIDAAESALSVAPRAPTSRKVPQVYFIGDSIIGTRNPQAPTEQVEETFCEGLYRGAMGIPPIVTSPIPQVAQASAGPWSPPATTERVATEEEFAAAPVLHGKDKFRLLADRLEGK
jgi:hypothetical protein